VRLYVIGVAYCYVLGGNHRLGVSRCRGAESNEEGRCR
jgi:hypothetical protein